MFRGLPQNQKPIPFEKCHYHVYLPTPSRCGMVPMYLYLLSTAMITHVKGQIPIEYYETHAKMKKCFERYPRQKTGTIIPKNNNLGLTFETSTN